MLQTDVPTLAVAAHRELFGHNIPASRDAGRYELEAGQVIDQGFLFPLDDEQRDVVATFLGRPSAGGGQEVAAEEWEPGTHERYSVVSPLFM
jgi:hypothetical protein